MDTIRLTPAGIAVALMTAMHLEAAPATHSWSLPVERVRRRLLLPAERKLQVKGRGGVCPCGGPWVEADRTCVLYDERPMTVITRRCSSCGGERTLYFRLV